MTLLCKEIWPLSLVSLRGIKITHKGGVGGQECSRRTCTQFVSSYFKYCETQNRHQRFSKLQTDVRGGEMGSMTSPGWGQISTKCLMLCGYHGQLKKKKRLRWFLARVGTFCSPRTLGYLRLCCPSFALCPPYKYSSRIKGSPLASWPVTRLSLLVPAESVRARWRGRGYTHLSDWTIFRKFETMTWQDTPGSTFERGPLFVCQKCVRVMEGEIMALRGFEERSQSMDSVILKEETV